MISASHEQNRLCRVHDFVIGEQRAICERMRRLEATPTPPPHTCCVNAFIPVPSRSPYIHICDCRMTTNEYEYVTSYLLQDRMIRNSCATLTKCESLLTGTSPVRYAEFWTSTLLLWQNWLSVPEPLADFLNCIFNYHFKGYFILLTLHVYDQNRCCSDFDCSDLVYVGIPNFRFFRQENKKTDINTGLHILTKRATLSDHRFQKIGLSFLRKQ